MPEQTMKFMLGTLQDLEHHIRTAYNTSESSMYNYSTIHFQGIFQGNGAGTTNCVTIGSLLLEIMKGAGHGITSESPLYQDEDILVVFLFVENTKLVEGDLTKTEITIEYVYISMQKSINRC